MGSPFTDTLAYRVVYDVRHAMPNVWWLIAILLVLGSAGYAIYREAHRFDSSKAGFIGLTLMVIGGVGTLAVIGGSVVPYVGMRLRVADGSYRVVEGTVRRFQPGDIGDHRSESWVLESASGSVSYSYSPSIVVAGYDQTAPHGVQVREGLHARVWDMNGRIARLELAP